MPAGAPLKIKSNPWSGIEKSQSLVLSPQPSIQSPFPHSDLILFIVRTITLGGWQNLDHFIIDTDEGIRISSLRVVGGVVANLLSDETILKSMQEDLHSRDYQGEDHPDINELNGRTLGQVIRDTCQHCH